MFNLLHFNPQPGSFGPGGPEEKKSGRKRERRLCIKFEQTEPERIIEKTKQTNKNYETVRLFVPTHHTGNVF